MSGCPLGPLGFGGGSAARSEPQLKVNFSHKSSFFKRRQGWGQQGRPLCWVAGGEHWDRTGRGGRASRGRSWGKSSSTDFSGWGGFRGRGRRRRLSSPRNPGPRPTTLRIPLRARMTSSRRPRPPRGEGAGQAPVPHGSPLPAQSVINVVLSYLPPLPPLLSPSTRRAAL